jgi:cell division septal protein FtsQ
MKMMAVRLLTSAVLSSGIVGCFYLYSYLTTSDKLTVTNVEFRGISRLEPGDIDRLVKDLKGQNILVAQLEHYAARFESHPRIRRAEFKRVLPNKVLCTVTEREPVALVFTNKFHEVDREGMIMTGDDVTDMLDLPIITGLDNDRVREGRRCADADLESALATLSLCKRYGGRFAENISELKVGKKGVSIVSLRDGIVLLLGKSDFESRLKKYFVMKNTIADRDESATVIDLRFDDQIVLRGTI